MNKQQIIDKLNTKLLEKGVNYPKWELCSIIEPFLEIVFDTLNSGESVQLSNFGKFTVKHQKVRKYYNMQKGTVKFSSPKRVIAFTPHRRFCSIPSNDRIDK